MLNLTRLWCGATTPGDGLRYGVEASPGGPPAQARVHHRPVTVWNTTRLCNLHCAHCYIAATTHEDPLELDTPAAFQVVEQLACYRVPVLLFSGGEPLARPDLLELAAYATASGLRTGLSTNGTLLTPEVVGDIQKAGVTYVGVSIDGTEVINDKFRGSLGAYKLALNGIRNAMDAGFRVSLRFTLTRYNLSSLGDVFDLVYRQRIPRVCIYHLAYAGRGSRIVDRADLSPQETRQAVDQCIEWAEFFQRKGLDTEVLTVDNHADAVYLASRVLAEQPQRAPEVLSLLGRNGGNASGIGIGAIGPRGDVHADQFSHHYSFGNVKERPFGAIWEDTADPIMAGLKSKPRPLEGRCAACPALALCNGNLRVRAETATGNPWGPDPACYLTDAELRTVGEVLRAA